MTADGSHQPTLRLALRRLEIDAVARPLPVAAEHRVERERPQFGGEFDQVAASKLTDQTRIARRPPQGWIMSGHEFAVGRHAEIKFDLVGAHGQSQVVSRESILRGVSGRPPMGDHCRLGFDFEHALSRLRTSPRGVNEK